MPFYGIIVIIIILWVAWFKTHPDFPEIQFETLKRKKKFKTGDIILFHALDNNFSPLMASYYTHIGIVLEWDGVPYIFEAAPANRMPLIKGQNPRGIFISLLQNRIRKYKGFTYYKELKYPLNKQKTLELLEFINWAIDNMEYDYNYLDSALKKGLLGNPCSTKTNCGEMVFLSLLKLGLLPKSYYDLPVFHHLRWMCDIRDLQKNKYLDPVKIIDHPF